MLERTIAVMRGTVRSKPSGSGGERHGAKRTQSTQQRTEQAPQGRGTPVGHVSRVFREVYEAERVSVGAIALARRPESLHALAERAFERLGKEARRGRLRLENAVDSGLTAPCDPERILKVLLHLIANAIAVSDERGKIVVSARTVESGIVISVRDEGPGIDLRAWPYLFREGWKDPSRKGEGLGLTVSKAIVHAHGGKIWCESALGRGTTFNFTLPTSPNEPATEPSAPLSEALSDEGATLGA